MRFYLLRTGKLHKKTKKSRLKNFPAGFVGSFYRNLADNVDKFIRFVFYGRIANDSNMLSETFKNISLQLLTLLRVFKLTLIIM